ncbi:MAG: InlB B-repeat-containing protein, partial [Clostridia bacterium]|nr:InlB B-repeat-containing protein [Clostridia bacterium]
YLTTDTYAVYTYTSEGWSLVIENLTSEIVTLTFDANGGVIDNDGEETEIYSITVNKGDSIDLPTPTREGYAFTGWYYGTGANAGHVTDVTPISRDMTLTAKWERCYEMSAYYLSNTELTESGNVSFEYNYEGNFSTTGYNNITIEIELDGVVYSANEAIINGYISEYEVYNGSNYFYGNIYFVAFGEYTVYLSYSNSSAAFEVTVSQYVYSGSVYVEYIESNNYLSSPYYTSIAEVSISDVNSTDSSYVRVAFHAPSDATVSVTLNGNQVDYFTSYSSGNYYVYFNPKTIVNYTPDTYIFVVTVSSEDYGSGSAIITYTLEQVPDFYYTCTISSTLYTCNSTYFELYYYGEESYSYPIVTISDGTNIYTINCTQYSNSSTISDNDNNEVLNYELYYNENNIYGYLTFYVVGDYDVTIAFGEDADSLDINVINFRLYSYNTDIYTDEYTHFAAQYYGSSEYEYPEITITSTDGYSYTYSITNYGNYYSYDDSIEATEDTNATAATTYLYVYWNNNAQYMSGEIIFYEAGTYTVTIAFGEDSISYTVTVTEYVFEGDVTLKYIYWGGNSVNNGSTITGYTDEDYSLYLVLDAPQDYVVTAAIDGTEIADFSYNDSWSYGELYLYLDNISFADLVNNTTGTYSITITVSSESNGSVTVTLTYVLAETPAYVYAIISDSMDEEYYSVSDGIDAAYTGYIPAYSSEVICIAIYAASPEITVTLNGTALTKDTDYYIEQEDNLYIVYIYASVLEVDELTDFTLEGLAAKAALNTIVVNAADSDSTATATLSIYSIVWLYEEYTYDTTIAENYEMELVAAYCGNSEGNITITITGADGYEYTYTLSDGTNYFSDSENTAVYATVYTESSDYYNLIEVSGEIYFYVSGEYTVTVTCGTESIVVAEPYDYKGVDFNSVSYGEYYYSQGVSEASETINISGTTEIIYYFIPATDGIITITTTGSVDTYGYLYQGDDCIADDDDEGYDANFLITYTVTAGLLYEIHICGFDEYESGISVLSISGVIFVYGDSSDISLPEAEDIVITDSTSVDSDIMELAFKAAKDSTVTIKVNGVEIDTTNIVSTEWNMGTLTINVDPRLCTGTTAGTYTITVTVSSETYSCSDTAEITYTLAA